MKAIILFMVGIITINALQLRDTVQVPIEYEDDQLLELEDDGGPNTGAPGSATVNFLDPTR